jgi:hypothetical protein
MMGLWIMITLVIGLFLLVTIRCLGRIIIQIITTYTFPKSTAFSNPGIHPGLEKPGVYLLRTYTSKTNIYMNTKAQRQVPLFSL